MDLKTVIKLDEIVLKGIDEIDKVEGNAEDFKEVYKRLSKVVPPVSKDKHNIWVGIYPQYKVFLDVVSNGKDLEKIIYFKDVKSKVEISFNKKGEVKKKEIIRMGNYPRYYNSVVDVWLDTFRELNKETMVVIHNNKNIRPKYRVDEYMESKRAEDVAVMINPDVVLEDKYNSISSMYRRFFNIDIHKCVIEVSGDSKLYAKEGAEWVEIYDLDK